MTATLPQGRVSSSTKYDLLSALGSYALARGKTQQRQALRVITLITARYNWARNELRVGQREIARLWSVDERTVKRETARLRASGWFVVKRQGARGRVTEYGLDIHRILEDTRGQWSAVGPDFEARMTEAPRDEKVVPIGKTVSVAPPDAGAGDEWSLARLVLHSRDAASFGSWINALSREGRAGGRLTLKAPSRFHCVYVQTHLAAKLLSACQEVDDDAVPLCAVL